MRVIPKIRYKTKFHQPFYTVLFIKIDKNGFPKFLIYENNAWLWFSAKYFEPFESYSKE